MTPPENVEELLETPFEWYPRGDGQPGWANAIGPHVGLLEPQADGTFIVTFRCVSRSIAQCPARWHLKDYFPAPTQTLEQRSQALAHSLLGLAEPVAPPLLPPAEFDLTRPLPADVFLRVVSDARFRALPSLRLRGRTGYRDSFDASLDVFSALPFACKELVFDEVSASPEAWAHWAQAPSLRQLQQLSLKFDTLKDFNDRSFERLVNSAESLERLSLFWLDLSLPKVRALVASPLAQRLETLCLGNSAITPQVADALLAARFPRLRRLHLRELEVSGPTEQLLRAHPNRPALRALEIKRYDATVWVPEPNPSPLFFPAAVHRYVKTAPDDWSVHQQGDFAAYEDNHVVEKIPARTVVRHSLGHLAVGTSGCKWPQCCSA